MIHFEKVLGLWTIFAYFVILMEASHADMTVCPDGCGYMSIQSAINAAKAEDSVLVYGPTFKENLVVNKTLTIRGLIANSRRPVLAAGNDTMAILLADGITLRGFSFVNPHCKSFANDGPKDCSILIVNSRGNSIYLNDFADNNGICSNGPSSWNSSQTINYQYNSKIFSGCMGNYWGDYAGSDKDGDGIGDQPKVVAANNVDYHPLMEPSESYVIKGEKQEVENTIQVKLNQPFDISLDSNPTTGYRWTVDFDSHFLKGNEKPYTPSEPRLLGSGGQQIFTFTPIRVGKTKVTAVYKRPWENIVADERAFSIVISE